MNFIWLGMFFETKYGKIKMCHLLLVHQLGMFFETKYGKILQNFMTIEL